MQLFLDIDGVLLNFEHAFVRFLNGERGLGLPADYETPTWLFEDLFSPEEMHRCWLQFLDSDYAGRMPPLVEPQRFNALARGHEVHLLTNFPLPFMAKRERNLAALGLTYDTLHFCGLHQFDGQAPPSKAELVERLRVAEQPGLFMDDHPENCLDVLRHCPGVEVWLMTRRFNREFEHPRIARAHGWGPLFERLNGKGRP